jgi:hypothetical protein
LWKGIGEPAEVLSGFKDAEFTPLQNARLAHAGKLDPTEFDPHFSDPPRDEHFQVPKGVSLTRDADTGA